MSLPISATGAVQAPTTATTGATAQGQGGTAKSTSSKDAEAFERMLLGQLTKTLADSALPEDSTSAATSAYKDMLPDALVEQAMAMRGDLAASRMQVDIAERALRSTKWEWAPTIAAVGSYQWSSVAGLTGQQSNWLAQVVAQFSIFDGGRLARLREGSSRVRQANANTEGVRRQVEREVRTAALDLESARANLESAREQERLAVENATLAETSFRAGAATYLDVVDANSARFGAGVARVSEELNVQTATLRLLQAVGLDASS